MQYTSDKKYMGKFFLPFKDFELLDKQLVETNGLKMEANASKNSKSEI